MFQDGDDLRGLPLLERKKRLKSILPRHKLIAFSHHRKQSARSSSRKPSEKALKASWPSAPTATYLSGARTEDWLKIKTAKRQEVVIAGFTAPRRTRPLLRSACARGAREARLALYRSCRHRVHTRDAGGAARQARAAEDRVSLLSKKVKDEAVTTWVKPSLVAEVKFTEWTSSRRNAPSRIPGASRGQAGGRRRQGRREAA